MNADADSPLTTLQREGREQLRKLALDYTRQYSDANQNLKILDETKPIVMSGHQPLLFHPGVWFKNFSLSSLGDAVGATAINLVVDNDVCETATIRCPQMQHNVASLRSVSIDASHLSVPYEARPIVDAEIFESFGRRAADRIDRAYCQRNAVSQPPLVRQLWPEVIAAGSAQGKNAPLGAVLAAGRHRLEQACGLNTLEVPISHVAQMPAFAQFSAAVISEQRAFNEIYNTRLVEYRRVHGIRSTAHPVPQLEKDNGWLESPFWIWSDESPTRRRLFVKQTGDSITLTDRCGWQTSASLPQLPQALIDLSAQRIAFRPRALITTLFSRLVLCDRFLHGIGGAKYDQLTDVIASDFFGFALPAFSTLTATMHLPFGQPFVTKDDLTAVRQQIRERQFHPERFVDRSEATEPLINRKLAAINDASISRLERHREITAANQALQPFILEQVQQLRERMADLPAQIQASRIFNSREYSFCLFPDSLIAELKKLATA